MSAARLILGGGIFTELLMTDILALRCGSWGGNVEVLAHLERTT